jgi:RimJ/RimL family protein N-acetyltransferase
VRRQYHFWPGVDGLDAWDVDRLITLAAGLPVEDVSLASIGEIDTPYWFSPEPDPTVRRVVEHMRLVADVETHWPIILGPDGRVMDGMHRIARALLDGRASVPGVRLPTLPAPDFRNCRPDELPYFRVGFRPMVEADLPQVAGWMGLPHVAEWWAVDAGPEMELEEYRRRLVDGEDAGTILMMVLDGDRSVGWCQWYRWDDYPVEAAQTLAGPGDAGIDYAIGEPDLVGQGFGTAMIGALVEHVRTQLAGGGARPAVGFTVAPEAANAASRRILEKNGFRLIAEQALDSEPHDRPMAIYRLDDHLQP